MSAGAFAPPRLFTVAEYHLMAKAGILTEDDRVELIEGALVVTSPIGSRHAACVDRVAALLHDRVSGAIVRVQNPVRLSDRSEPQPDLSLVRARDDFYAAAHPGPEDVLLDQNAASGAGRDRRRRAGAGPADRSGRDPHRLRRSRVVSRAPSISKIEIPTSSATASATIFGGLSACAWPRMTARPRGGSPSRALVGRSPAQREGSKSLLVTIKEDTRNARER